MDRFLTTKELAELLRLKERKVYDMAAAGEVPCTRATGKLLFPRDAIDAWLEEHTERQGVDRLAPRPGLVLGSHDPLLEWALRDSRSGLATYFDSSRDGLDRFALREGIVTGLHILEAEADDAADPADPEAWNIAAARKLLGRDRIVLVEWAWRQRGLILAVGNPLGISSLEDLKGRSVVPRQESAGSQELFLRLAARDGLALEDIEFLPAALSESDAALAVLEGRADAAFGLYALAAQYRLAFVPVVAERFDLVIDRRSYFDPPLQALFQFCRSESFAAKARELKGYDVSGLGTVHFNGA